MNSILSKLSPDQIDFLNEHEISFDLLFDVKGRYTSEFKEIMGRLGKKVAYNTKPCPTSGHTLKNRHGHCIQCDTKHIRFITRREGYTYIACSFKSKLLKIGFAENIENRELSLNSSAYGNVTDWKIFFYCYSKEAAKIERATQRELSMFQRFESYFHDGFNQIASEIYRCSSVLAKSTLERKVKEGGGDIKQSHFIPEISERFEVALNI